jgi:hypothetical protein
VTLLPILGLRSVCAASTDCAGSSPIESSAEGECKIAAAIAELVRSQDAAALQAVL